jgi:type IV fimbrial biogenesis protein FimT
MSLTPAIPDPRRPRASGFTVIELMVTVAVAAILVAVAVPAFNNFVMTDRDIGQVNSLVASFNYARSEAIKQHLAKGVQVCPSDDGTTCTGGAAWSSGWVVINHDPTLAGTPLAVIQSVPALGGNNTVTAAGTGATGVTFQPNGGTLGSETLTIIVCDPRGAAYARDVEVTATGKVAASQKQGEGVGGNALACP